MAKLKAPFALDRSLNTTEQTSRNIADVLAEELSAIITALGGLNFINYEVVAELPTTEISTTTIYLVPSDDPQSGNTYDEYINLNGTVSGWEKIGSTAIDLSGYYTSAETDALLDEKVDKDSFDEQTATDEFTTINGGLLSECKVALSPIQDLHGYDHPWVGGAGKNKLPLPIAETKNGVTLTRNADGSITLSGNNGGGATYFDFFAGDFDSTTYAGYVFRADSTFTVFGTVSISFRISPNDRTSLQELGGNNDYTINNNGSGLYFAVRVASNYSIPTGGVTIYPMLRSSADTSDFEPYSNICPISGHTQAKLEQRGGKNKFDDSLFDTDVGDTLTYVQFAVPNGNYVMSTPDFPIVNTIVNVFFLAGKVTYGASSAYNGVYKDRPISITVTDGYYTVFYRSNNSTNHNNPKNFNWQIEEGSSATDYEPYQGKDYIINLGGTYYSGNLDVVSGVFVPDTAKYVLTDVSVLELYTTDTTTGSYAKIKTTEYPSIKEDVSSELASSCKVVAFADRAVDVHDNRFFINTNYILIRASIDENVTTVNELFAIFENCEFILPLANPTPIQLTPQQVQALVGENNLSAPLDGQEITEVKYKKMFTFDDVIAYIQSLS